MTTKDERKEVLKGLGFEMKNLDERIVVTPVIAKVLLDSFNRNPRGINKQQVRYYAKQIKEGAFNGVCGAPLGFNKELWFKDGQHRLAAICETGMPMLMKVQYDVDESKLDIGRTRGTRFIVYEMVGEDFRSGMDNIARVVLALKKGIYAIGQSQYNVLITNTEIANEIKDNINLYLKALDISRDVMRSVRGHYKLSDGHIGGVYVYLASCGVSEEVLDKFFDKVENWRTDRKIENRLKLISAAGNKQKLLEWARLWMHFQGFKKKDIDNAEGFVTNQWMLKLQYEESGSVAI